MNENRWVESSVNAILVFVKVLNKNIEHSIIGEYNKNIMLLEENVLKMIKKICIIIFNCLYLNKNSTKIYSRQKSDDLYLPVVCLG